MYTLSFDGLLREVPGKSKGGAKAGFMCYGWVILEGETLIARGYGAFADGKDATSNLAEYLALIEGMEALLDMGAKGQPLEVCGDARTVIEQMQGLARINAERVKPLHHRAHRLSQSFGPIQWVWTPRRNNRAADALTRRAMHQIRSNPDEYQATVSRLSQPAKEKLRLRSVLDLRIYFAGAGRI